MDNLTPPDHAGCLPPGPRCAAHRLTSVAASPGVSGTARRAPAGAPHRASAARQEGWADRLNRYPGVWVFWLYLAVALFLEHRALEHLNSVCACTSGPDPTEYMWGFVWFPHAILHGLNPFVTHLLWAGSPGFDLAQGTFTPAEALVAWPLTATAGPLVAFNVLAILAPVLSAWVAYRLCLYLTGRPAASVVGGYLFGFSTYELGQLLGHLQLSVTFVIPAAVLLTVKRLDARLSRRSYALGMAALLLFQLFTSTEVLLSLTLFGLATLGIGWVVGTSAQRRNIVAALPPLLAAYAVMAIVGGLYLYYALRGHPLANGPISADLLSFVAPTWLTGLGSHAFFGTTSHFPGNLVEQGTYLGLPLIVIMGAYGWETRSRSATRVLIAMFGLIAIAALGEHLYVAGHRGIGLPWSLVSSLPLVRLLTTVRFGVYLALLTAVAAALWLAQTTRRPAVRWLLAGLSVGFLLPNFGADLPGTNAPLFTTRYPTPRLFATDEYRRYLRPGEIVLPLPYGAYGYSLLWQARTNLYFRLASGRFPQPPSTYPRAITLELMGKSPMTADAPALLRAFMTRLRVAAVIADPRAAGPWLGVLARLGLRPITVGGILLYRL